jgi:hypothetical protein
MRFEKVLVTIEVKVKQDDLQQLPCSANVVGATLADIAIDYETETGVGYFPAIEFFKTRDDVDPDLIESAEQVSWLVAKRAREIIQTRLRPIFSSVQFQSIQNTAFSLPRVRPRDPELHEKLAEHYTPDSVKVELLLTMMRKDSDSMDGRAEPYGRKMMFRWLESQFESVEVTSSREIDV